MDPLDLKRSIVLAAVLGFIVASATIPFYQTIKGPCYTRPGAVWSLSRSGAGEITTGWERNYFNPGAPRILMQFERPDLVEVVFMPDLYDGAFVQAGDTLAYIVSRERVARRDILQATADLSQSEYDALLTGARVEDLEVARAEIKRAEAALETYKYALDRAERLHNDGLIADSSWEATKGEYKILEAELELARANYKALKAGARPEDIEVARRQVNLSEQSLVSNEGLLGHREVIIAPLNGQVRFRGDPVELIRVEMMDTLAVLALVPEDAASLLQNGQNMEIMLSADQVPHRFCQLFRIDFGRPDQMGVQAIGLLDNKNRTLQPGMTGYVQLPLGKKTLITGLRAKFHL